MAGRSENSIFSLVRWKRHSPYNYTFNNPIRFIDPDGMAPEPREGPQRRRSDLPDEAIKPTITIHFLGNKSSYSKDDIDRNNKAKELVIQKYKEAGVDMDVSIKYGGKPISKKDFYSTGSSNDSYVIVGTNQQLIDAEKEIKDGGWDGPDRGNYSDRLGITMGRDLMAFVNAEKLNEAQKQDGVKDDFRSPAERLAIGGVVHELGHHFFRGHSEFDSGGHHPDPKSIMHKFPSRDGVFDKEMLKMLKDRFGQ